MKNVLKERGLSMNERFRPSTLKFSLEDVVWFRKGEEISELISLSLEPEVTVQEFDHYISIRGALNMFGEYRRVEEDEENDDGESFNFSGQKFVDVNPTREMGIYEFHYDFPVDITIPIHRIREVNELNLDIDSFDYVIPENGSLILRTDIVITGVYEEVREEEEIEQRKLDPLDQYQIFDYEKKPSLSPIMDFSEDEENEDTFTVEARKIGKLEKEHQEIDDQVPIQIFMNEDNDEKKLEIEIEKLPNEREPLHTKEHDTFIEKQPLIPNEYVLSSEREPLIPPIPNLHSNEKTPFSKNEHMSVKQEFVDENASFSNTSEIEKFNTHQEENDYKSMSSSLPSSDFNNNQVENDRKPTSTSSGDSELKNDQNPKENQSSASLFNNHQNENELSPIRNDQTIEEVQAEDLEKSFEHDHAPLATEQPQREKNISYQANNQQNEKQSSISLLDIFAHKEEERVAKMKVYIVQEKDTLNHIAEKYDINVSQILRVNHLEAHQDVYAGQVIYIPMKSKIT